MTRDRARKAAVRQHAEATGHSYTRAGHTLTAGDPPPPPSAPAPAPIPSPAQVVIDVHEFDGPTWGGDWHSHGVSIAVSARADAGRGAYLGPANLPDGVQKLSLALENLPADEGPGFDVRQLEQLHQALFSLLPGCDIEILEDEDPDYPVTDADDPATEAFEAQDEADDFRFLFDTELTWDCIQPTCR